jgi:hypothetical protein
MPQQGTPDPGSRGGHAADRLREFLAQRFGRQVKGPPDTGDEETPAEDDDERPSESPVRETRRTRLPGAPRRRWTAAVPRVAPWWRRSAPAV